MTLKTFSRCLSFTAAILATAPLYAGDWPQWRGPNRDGKSSDTGLLKQWPAGGPVLAWKATGLGAGYSGVAVVGDRIYTMGDRDDGSFVIALSNGKDAKVLWSAKVGQPGAPGWGNFAGPRCTPTITDGLVFAVDQWGELVCVNADDGKEKWRKNYETDFGAKRPEWGFSESPLVDGDRVIVYPGGSQGGMVALDKQSGKTLWTSKDFTDGAQYSSVQRVEIGGEAQYLQLTMANLVAISPKDGSVLWKAARKGATAVIPTPIVDGDYVYVTSSYGTGCNLFKVSHSDGKFSAEQVYANKTMANHHGGVIKVGDMVYGYSEGKGLVCQNFKSGALVWSERNAAKKGSISFADGVFYCREEDSGDVLLVPASETAFSEKGRIKQPSRSSLKAWPHPTIANGFLYLRDQDVLLCYAVK